MLNNVGMSLDLLKKISPELVQGIFQNGSGSHTLHVIMDQDAWYPQGSHRKTGENVNVIKVIVHVPVDIHVRDHIHFGVVEISYSGKINAGTVCLDTVGKHLVDVFDKELDGYSLVSIVSCYIQTCKGHEVDLRMCLEEFGYRAFVVSFLRDIKQHFVRSKFQHFFLRNF